MRLFADCENSVTAQGISIRLTGALSSFSPKVFNESEPYWKMPELFEFTFTLTPTSESTFHSITANCNEGWLHMGGGTDRSSVWNRASGTVFLIPEVAWAEVALHD
jgi:hypothetical protein